MEAITDTQERRLLEAAAREEMLVDAQALKELSFCSEALEVMTESIQLAREKGSFMITHGMVADVLASKQSEKKALPVAVANVGFVSNAAEMEAKLIVFRDKEVTEKSRCTGTLEDFVSHFRNRFEEMKGMMRPRPSEHPFVDISRAKAYGERKKTRVSVMVYDKKETKNGHWLLEVEDDKSAMLCLASKNSPMHAVASSVLVDDAITVEGFMSKDLFIIEQILWPELSYKEKKKGTQDAYIGFMSDLHVGSKFFLQKQFHQFLEFLNGNGTEEEREIAGKIKYLFFAGDLVDGVGVYPLQEKQLVTRDVYEQYALLKEFMTRIPEHIHCIVAPGNHDAVRTAEPQPSLPKEFTQGLEEKENMHFIGNPGWFEVDGLKVLMYHGTSVDPLISALNLKDGYNNPEKIAIELLKRRHLAPSYGDKPLVPEKKDYMLVDSEPDIFHFGHVHKNGYGEYRGCMVVNSGTWQDTTDYQQRLGHIPTPCQLPLYHLTTGNLKVLNFRGN
ncbi:DNA-directed DNA polymerase II small subunit [Candidatus Micrarchaeota archaeon]|nr:DNA-directed DNA polymerase II small subunit [Candidatus Micrarchaeota archaeon]